MFLVLACANCSSHSNDISTIHFPEEPVAVKNDDDRHSAVQPHAAGPKPAPAQPSPETQTN
jgi:hypothetical protein